MSLKIICVVCIYYDVKSDDIFLLYTSKND